MKTHAARRSRLADIERVIRWRESNPIGRKLAEVRADKDTGQRHARRLEFLELHRHACINCRGPYDCSHACDPIKDGLTNSICDPCFSEVS